MFQAFVTTQVSISGRSVVPGASVCPVSGVAVSDIDAEGGLAVCAHVSQMPVSQMPNPMPAL